MRSFAKSVVVASAIAVGALSAAVAAQSAEKLYTDRMAQEIELRTDDGIQMRHVHHGVAGRGGRGDFGDGMGRAAEREQRQHQPSEFTAHSPFLLSNRVEMSVESSAPI